MSETLLRAQGEEIIEMPRALWEGDLAQAPETCEARLAFMSDEHHRVRYHAVEQLARRGEPLSPSRIAEDLDLPPARVAAILEELERNLFFLVRNGDGHVSWAFPVTVDPTPHRLVFSTGERLHGA
jgi:hypothetical protein